MANETTSTYSSSYGKRPLWHWVILYLVIGAIIYGVVYYFFISKQNNRGYNYQNSTTAPTSQTPALNTVTIKNFVFNPGTLNVKSGTTVTWINEDSAPHTVDSSLFNSPTLKTGEKFSYTFNSPGTIKYSCSIHPSMTAIVLVE